MKKLLFVVCALMVAAAASAQRVEMGVRAGISSQDLQLKASDVMTESKMGWHLAAVSRLRLVGFGDGLLGAGLFLQPEIVYSQNGYRMQEDRRSDDVVARSSGRIRMQTVDIPVLLSLKVSIVRVQAGPVFNVLNNYSSVSGNLELDPSRSSVGYALGASVDIGAFTLDGRYHGEFKELKNSIRDGGTTVESVRGSLSSWSLGLAILF